jgi:DNA-directed RNA polymerase subunit beta
MVTQAVRNFGRVRDVVEIPDLVAIQKRSYERFLQAEVAPTRRKGIGLEALFREIFPIVNYDKTMRLEYLYYELEKPRYTPNECRQLRLTYGYPLKICCRLRTKEGEDLAEQSVYLGEMPVMIGGGEFIFSGAERAIVSQLHRSPGVDFLIESKEGDRVLHGGRIIPERGSWIEIGVTRKDVLVVKIDQSSKIPATIFLRAMGPDYGTTAQILRLFYPTKTVSSAQLTPAMWAVEPIADVKTGEIIAKAGTQIGDRVSLIQQTGTKKVEVIEEVRDALILNTLAEDDCQSQEQALLKFYMRLRPGNPANEKKAQAFFDEKFSDVNRYRLGKVGRFRLNRKFGQTVDEGEMTLRPEDFFNTMKYVIALRSNEGTVDDIDHLGNRRLRTIDELAGDEIRKGLLRLRKTVQERMSFKRDVDESVRIADLVNSKSVSSSINYFFGRGELSQIVDQTNALSQLTHERRLSALGPGGLNRRRAGFEVRDVHISHYGRICPVETPEGTNIGLISSLAIFATVDEYGFLLTPYRRVEKGKATDKVDYLRADEDMKAVIVAPNTFDPDTREIQKGMVLAMKGGELAQVPHEEVNYVDVSAKQIVGVSASLIPFLEHDDANRALMGSNMQRQAVPLLKTEAPLVGTGMEKVVGQNSSMVVRAKSSGVVTSVDATKIIINHTEEYKLAKFVGLNERTCLNQRPIVKLGEKIQKDQIIADGGGTADGVLALGKNVLVGFVSFDGFNFEDAIIISEKLVRNDSFTSIHIDEFTSEVRETRLGREEFTRDIPNVSEKALRSLDEHGVIRDGTRVCPGDILVGKVVPKSKTELTPEEKLLHAIFGRAGEDVKNDSLELPSGNEGVVIKTERFTRRGAGGEEQKKALKAQIKQYEEQMRAKECVIFRQMIEAIHQKFDVNIIDPSTRQKVGVSADDEVIYEQVESFDVKWVKPASARDDVQKVVDKFWVRLSEIGEEKNRRIDSLKHGDELASGVLEMVKVYIATKRTLSIGDKMAGRHGNKGVIAKIMPEEDMPFLEDGTPLDILLNPLGVPSRMNVGQILETHLGWVAKVLGFQAITPVFDGATEDDIQKLTEEANEYMEKRERELLPTSYILKSIPSVDEFFNKAQIGYVVVDHLNDPNGKDKERLEGFLNLLEGRAILKYADKEGIDKSKDYIPFFNVADPKGIDGKGKEKEKFELEWDDAVKKDNLLIQKFRELTTNPKWIPAKNACDKDTPKEPGVYCYKVQGRVVYVGQAGYRGGKGLRERLCDCHLKNTMDSSFRDHLKEFFSKPREAASPSPPLADEIFVHVPKSLKTRLYDGRTGEPFDQTATIGYMYTMKLHHLVDDKIHARATGPYSLITQQPLGGKARTGGQRFGEMEVWALEGYGAAYTLQEMLTVKSDDVEGRTKIYESTVKGQNRLEAGTPLSFDVLCNEIRGLGLNIQLEKKRLGSAAL